MYNTLSARLCSRIFLKHKFQKYSTQPVVKTEKNDTTTKDLIKEFEKFSNISVKKRIKKPQKPPFMKNVFVGEFDTDILAYPELEKGEYENLNKEIMPIENYIGNIKPIQEPQHLETVFMENLRQMRIFGLECSQLLNAREMGVMESCKFYDCLSTQSSSVIGLLTNEYLGIQILQKRGTEEQKKKYLPQLVSGNILSAFCLAEYNIKNTDELNTKAILSNDQKTWILNGEKFGVVNGSLADLLVVIAEAEFIAKNGVKELKPTAFLVERSFGGITSYSNDTLGVSGTDVSNVVFKNTPVPSGQRPEV